MIIRRTDRKPKKHYEIRLYLRVNQKFISLSPRGFPEIPELNWNELMSALEFFYRCRHFVLWAIGDLINYAVSKFGVTVPFATKGAPLDEVTCYKYRKLAETVPEPARVYQLIPRIQSYVFTMDDKETAAEILQKAEAEGWSLEKICEVREQFAPAIERSFITGE